MHLGTVICKCGLDLPVSIIFSLQSLDNCLTTSIASPSSHFLFFIMSKPVQFKVNKKNIYYASV